MSSKTEIDGFSGHHFHTGHGIFHVREDKHLMAFESRKSFRMWQRKRNPRKITWTEHYRHDHKKGVVDAEEKVVRANRVRVARGYAGVASDANAKMATSIVKQRVASQKKAGAKAAPKKK